MPEKIKVKTALTHRSKKVILGLIVGVEKK